MSKIWMDDPANESVVLARIYRILNEGLRNGRRGADDSSATGTPMTTLRLDDGETLADAFERVTRERDELLADRQVSDTERLRLAAEVRSLRALLAECRPVVVETCRPMHRESRYCALLARIDAALKVDHD